MHNKLNQQNEIEIVCDCGMAKWLQGGAISSIIEKFQKFYWLAVLKVS